MSDLISREDAIHILACEMYAEAQAEGYDTKLEDYIPEAKAWMNDAPSAEAVSREAIISAKFHPYPFTQITPTDVEAESYKRGWNDALDAVVEDARESEVEE